MSPVAITKFDLNMVFDYIFINFDTSRIKLRVFNDFYHVEYWMPVKGDQITDQKVATVLFGQYVNMGGNAIKLAQTVAGVIADGRIGEKTLVAINKMNPEHFLDKLCIAMVARYYAIGMKDKTQRVWWPGWFGRALRIAA